MRGGSAHGRGRGLAVQGRVAMVGSSMSEAYFASSGLYLHQRYGLSYAYLLPQRPQHDNQLGNSGNSLSIGIRLPHTASALPRPVSRCGSKLVGQMIAT